MAYREAIFNQKGCPHWIIGELYVKTSRNAKVNSLDKDDRFLNLFQDRHCGL